MQMNRDSKVSYDASDTWQVTMKHTSMLTDLSPDISVLQEDRALRDERKQMP